MKTKNAKTRSSYGGIKVLNKSAGLGKRMKDAFVRTKRRAEEMRERGLASPTDYAESNAEDAARGAAREIVRLPANPGRKATGNFARAKEYFGEAARDLPRERRRPAKPARNVAIKTRERAQSRVKMATSAGETEGDAKRATERANGNLKEIRRAGRRPVHEIDRPAKAETGIGSGDPLKTASAKRRFVKIRAKTSAATLRTDGKSAAGRDGHPANPARDSPFPDGPPATPVRDAHVKDAGPTIPHGRKGPAGGAGDSPASPGNSAKTAKPAKKAFKGTAKGTIKTAKKSVKAAGQQAARTEEAARRAAKMAGTARRAARASAKAAVRTARTSAKAVVATAKAAIAGAKGLAALIAAGGWIAVSVVIFVCVIGQVAGSAFGIFFSPEPGGAGRSLPAAVSELGAEFYRKIDEIKSANAHDVADVGEISLPWDAVLAVYAVKVAGDGDSPSEVVTFDDEKLAILRGVLGDMVSLSHSLTTIAAENETRETVETVTLAIEAKMKSPDEAAELYGFDQNQKDMLRELLSDEHRALWTGMFEGCVAGDGEILESRADYVPLGIPAWPLPENFRISSGFGQRRDPFTGETEHHGGIDVAAPEGTPILASADGTVTFVNASDAQGGGRGYYLKIKHNGGLATLYAHCSRIAVLSGQEVTKGAVVAYVGSTGNSTGSHLHFEVHENGAKKDPLAFFAN
jgi:murein DD-endopeptidase MepM/ murein hydrolase activator NlpD